MTHQTILIIDEFINRSIVIQILNVEAKCQSYPTGIGSAERMFANQFILSTQLDNSNSKLLLHSSKGGGDKTNYLEPSLYRANATRFFKNHVEYGYEANYTMTKDHPAAYGKNFIITLFGDF